MIDVVPFNSESESPPDLKTTLPNSPLHVRVFSAYSYALPDDPQLITPAERKTKSKSLLYIPIVAATGNSVFLLFKQNFQLEAINATSERNYSYVSSCDVMRFLLFSTM